MQKELTRYLASNFRIIAGANPIVEPYHDEDEATTVHILRTPDAPDKGIDSYATVSLHTHPFLREDGSPLGFGVELVAIGEAGDERIPDILATAAFNIVQEGWIVAPDTIFPGIVSAYNDGGSMQHALFLEPLSGLWPKEVERFTHEGKEIAFLQMLPISDSEYAFADEHGVDALLDRLLEHEFAPHDLDREPVV